MNHRYTVYDGDQPFASVHAPTAEEAITSACTKVPGHDPKNCTATIQQANSENSWRTMESWSDFNWSSFAD